MAKGIAQLIDSRKRHVPRDTFSQLQGAPRLCKGGGDFIAPFFYLFLIHLTSNTCRHYALVSGIHVRLGNVTTKRKTGIAT